VTEHYVAVVICRRLYVKVTNQNSLIYLGHQKVAPKSCCYFFQKLWRAVVKVKVKTCTQWAWVQLSPVPTWVIGGDRKDLRTKLLTCTIKSPTYVDTSEPLSRQAVNVV